MIDSQIKPELMDEESSRPQTRRGTRESSGRWAGINSRKSYTYDSDDADMAKVNAPIKPEENVELEEIEEDDMSVLASLRLAHLDSRIRALGDLDSLVLTAKERRDIVQFKSSDSAQFELVLELARLLASSKHAVVFTGAGISTGSGADLPTIRGKFGVSTSQLKEEEFDPTCVQVFQFYMSKLFLFPNSPNHSNCINHDRD